MDGEKVFSLVGAPNRITPERLSTDLLAFARQIEPLPRPRVAVLIGGKSRAHDLPPERAADLARQIDEAVSAAGGSLLMTFSRRTPEPARKILASRLSHLPGVIWDDQGENPYFAFLAAADVILVTADSANLATDAAATGAPVYILDLVGGSPKFRLFHEDLQSMGISRPFQGALETWTYPPLAETARAAGELLRRYDARPRA
jgi:mitochondrial fission protein ELM1